MTQFIEVNRDALIKAIETSKAFYFEGEQPCYEVEQLREQWTRLNEIYASTDEAFPGLSTLTANFVSTHGVCMAKATPEDWMAVAQVSLRYYDAITSLQGEMKYAGWNEMDYDEPTEEEEWKAWAEYMENRNQPSNERATNWLW